MLCVCPGHPTNEFHTHNLNTIVLPPYDVPPFVYGRARISTLSKDRRSHESEAASAPPTEGEGASSSISAVRVPFPDLFLLVLGQVSWFLARISIRNRAISIRNRAGVRSIDRLRPAAVRGGAGVRECTRAISTEVCQTRILLVRLQLRGELDPRQQQHRRLKTK